MHAEGTRSLRMRMRWTDLFLVARPIVREICHLHELQQLTRCFQLGLRADSLFAKCTSPVRDGEIGTGIVRHRHVATS